MKSLPWLWKESRAVQIVHFILFSSIKASVWVEVSVLLKLGFVGARWSTVGGVSSLGMGEGHQLNRCLVGVECR